MGQRADLITALAQLEATIDPSITVYPLRPVTINTPAVYNWILSSPASVPATMTIEDTINIAVRVVVPSGDIADEIIAGLALADLTADVLDRDLVYPHKSVLRGVVHEAIRGSQRTLSDTFDSIPYLAWEFVVEATLRKFIPPA